VRQVGKGSVHLHELGVPKVEVKMGDIP